MDIKNLNEVLIRTLKEVNSEALNEDDLIQLHEMTIEFGRNLGKNMTVQDGIKEIEHDKADRINQIKQIKQERITLSNEDTDSSCWVSLDTFIKDINKNTYQFAILWGEEDIKIGDKNPSIKTPNPNKILKGHGWGHIYINHKYYMTTVKNKLESIIDDMIANEPITFKTDKFNGQFFEYITNKKERYIFKTATHEGNDYIYLHTAYV